LHSRARPSAQEAADGGSEETYSVIHESSFEEIAGLPLSQLRAQLADPPTPDEEGADARGEVTEPEDNSGDEEGDSDSQVVKTNIDLLSKTQQANDCYVWRKRFMCPQI